MKTILTAATLIATLAVSGAAVAQDFVQSGTTPTLPQREGQAIYNAVCSGCHMADGRGAEGAGAYPPLANSDFVESPDAVIAWVLNGYRAMPPLGSIMDDEQVAEVVNYVRHNLGNSYEGSSTAADVQAMRE
ncbi:c-type cytochrome [Falsigemmobacter intermedius]|uniref:C-type cytochrome n=1 Tax=Falsigemmobacter intermedius TaxID=1553448 RepID=A0A444MBR8_9RHOB|nr:cytochrome c [Falsigemmobacter intermedius]RWY41433.1 c-type cytochrome [Falsigemmobacter intermedius]